MIRGIGPVYAKKLLRAFGDKVFDVIEVEPDRLREVDGIGPMRASRIAVAWAEQKVVREIMVFLHSHGVGSARAVRIYKTYGADAVQVMSENPYRLARDIRGIGFKTADAIAMKLGIEKTAMIRVRAGISYALTGQDNCRCGPLAEKLLDVPQDLIRTALDLELADGTVIADRLGDTACVFLAGLHRAERAIAERLLTLNNGKLPWPAIDPGKAIPSIEQRLGLTLAESQKAQSRWRLVRDHRRPGRWQDHHRQCYPAHSQRILSAKDVSLLPCEPIPRRFGPGVTCPSSLFARWILPVLVIP
jgi:exodeoxyribonuclease V alpha subunit